jgi:hypothetical protein
MEEVVVMGMAGIHFGMPVAAFFVRSPCGW